MTAPDALARPSMEVDVACVGFGAATGGFLTAALGTALVFQLYRAPQARGLGAEGNHGTQVVEAVDRTEAPVELDLEIFDRQAGDRTPLVVGDLHVDQDQRGAGALDQIAAEGLASARRSVGGSVGGRRHPSGRSPSPARSSPMVLSPSLA